MFYYILVEFQTPARGWKDILKGREVGARTSQARAATAVSWSCFPDLESDDSAHLLRPLCPHILLPSALSPTLGIEAPNSPWHLKSSV